MPTRQDVLRVLSDSLQLSDKMESLDDATPLLGAIPELDSMAVVTIITGLEETFGFTVDDDEISAEAFETVGTLCAFVDGKLAA